MPQSPLAQRVALATFLILFCPSNIFGAPATFSIPSQPQFGTFVSGYLTFDPFGIYFAGPFDISVGAIPSAGLPAAEFSDSNTFYVIQPNTSFHSLWVLQPYSSNSQQFLFVAYDSCVLSGSTITSCTFSMNYYLSQCSDCPPTASVQGVIIGTPVPEHVTIDIKPDTFPNSINPKSRGVISVAILTTPTFDATTVDPRSLQFGPTFANPIHSALKDVDGDGALDMILQFRTQETGIQCGDTKASLTGQTNTGQAIEGSDSIRTVGCH
jgi:hypothetical protein